MTEWRYTAYDMRDGDKLTDLHVESWESTDELRGLGSFKATVELDGAAATATEARRTVVADSTQVGRSLIVAERDGIPVFSGIVWRRRYDAQTRRLTIAGAGMRSYFNHFWPNASVTYTADDQFAIVRALVALVESSPGTDLGLQVTSTNSGVLRDRTYPRTDGLSFGELIQNLSDLVGGFDWDVRVEYDAGAVERWVRLWYPRRGRELSATNLRFRAPGNATLFDMEHDGTEMAVRVFAVGAGDGQDMLMTTASRNDLIAAGFPGYSARRAWKDVTRLSTLAQHAEAEVDRLSGVDGETFTVQVDPTFPGQPWGSWELGDDCQLIVDDDPLFPAQDDRSPGLTKLRRVLAHTWLQSGSSEELTVALGQKVVP